MTPPFVGHCTELLSGLGTVRVRRMFGGHGLYVDEVFIALIAGERLYLKVDENSRARFEAAGCEAFTYDAKGQQVSLGYWSAPVEAMDSPALMLPWARLALQAAVRARAAKPAATGANKSAAAPRKKARRAQPLR
jgi:DNA transformation protein and related proteins